MIRAGVLQSLAMTITGHETDSMFTRYNITDGRDKLAALAARRRYVEAQEGEGNVTEIRRSGRSEFETSYAVIRVRLIGGRCNMARMCSRLLVVSVAFLTCGTLGGQQAGMVDMKGLASKIKVEEVVAGHLQELNGHYKLRVSELTFEPGAHMGLHHHAGPGIRCVMAGQLELTFEQAGKSVYQAGDCFFESGDVTHTTENRGEKPVVVLNFEILSAAWSGSSAIPVPK